MTSNNSPSPTLYNPKNTSIKSLLSNLPSTKPQKPLTLVFMIKEGQILLAMKKRGFGKGRWNGFGGKIEKADASVRHGALRELHEESFIQHLPEGNPFNCIGRIFFNFNEKLEKTLFVVWVYCCFVTKENEEMVESQLKESEEMRPKWFDFEDIPYDSMWPDDRFWIPILLENVKKGDFNAGFEAFFDFPETFDEIGDYCIETLPDACTVLQKSMDKCELGRIELGKEE